MSSLHPARSRLPWLVGLGVVVAVGGVFLIMRPDQTEPTTTTTTPTPATVPPEPRMFRVEVVTDPSSAVIELDGQPVGTGAFARRLPSDGSEHEVVAHARGYRNAQVRFTDTPPPRELALEAIAAPAAPPPPVVETIARGKPDRAVRRHRHHNPSPLGASGERARNKPAPANPTGLGKDVDGPLPNKAPIVE